MRKLFILLIGLALGIIYFSCQREIPMIKNNNLQISSAHQWFDNYLKKEATMPIFDHLIYHWDKASSLTFRNGYQVITVPITEVNQNPAYQGRRVLYLYPWKNGKGFYSTIFELIPTREHQKNNNGNVSLKTFDGYISTWDLKKGFVRGAKFEKGIAEKNIKIQLSSPKQLSAAQRSSGETLPEVIVYFSGPGDNIYWILLLNGMANSTPYLWDGGGGYNPCEYTPCVNQEEPADYFDPKVINDVIEDLTDKQWLEEKVKDSTDNPCASDAINKLSSISDKLPELIRSFFNSDANFSMTIKMGDLGLGAGGSTTPNVTTNDFNVTLNSVFNDRTDLSYAATIIHEAFHCQLMSWFRETIRDNNQTVKEQLASDYGYLFSSEMISMDSSLAAIVNGGNPTQHQDMVNRYKDKIAEALYQFSQSKGINIDMDYCKDLAWTGTFDSRAFNNLPFNTRERILERVNAEIDPTGSKNINVSEATPKGKSCK